MKIRTKKIILILLILLFLCYLFTHLLYKDVFHNESSLIQSEKVNDKEYTFRNSKLLQEHYEKHGQQMGFKTKGEYELAASNVVNNPNALHKLEKEDNDDLYYLVETNEYVVVSKDGYIRTYFKPDRGKNYFDSK